jgi:PKD repeat protein
VKRAWLLVAALGSAAPAAAQIGGTVRYENRDYDAGGFTGTTQFIPVRRARVELVNTTTGNSWFGFTDDNGAYSILPTDTGAGSVFLRVYAQNTSGVTYNVEVLNNTGPSGAVYAAVSATVSRTLPTDATPLNLDLPASDTAAEAFNIFDAAVWAFDTVAANDAAAALAPLSPLPLLQIFWEPGAATGTFYDPGSPDRILLGGSSADDDGWDDDIILHELGHFVSSRWSQDDSPGGPHSITDLLDPRLAWSEGWAHAFSSAVRAYANTIKPGQPGPPNPYFDPWTQVDTFAVGNSFFDIEAPSFATDTITDQNEVAVAAGLWDITDTVNEGGFDTIGGAAKQIDLWRVFRVRIPGSADVTLEDFFKGWQVESLADATAVSGTAGGAGIFKDRQIRFYPDPDEPNDASGAPTPLGAIPPTVLLTRRTFFLSTGPPGVGDEDWYSFSLAAPGFLRVQTMNLSDAADTVLELYDAGLMLIGSNDDRSLADPSSLVEVSVAAGTYLARVRPAAGVAEYGAYDLQIEVATNLPPTATISAGPTSGAAPLATRFEVTASDPDGIVSLYEWDFDGDGVYEYASIGGGDVTHRFAQPGSWTAVLRITDNDGAVAFGSVTIDVTGAAGSVTVTASVVGSTQPVSVTLDAVLGGITPVAFEWDFDGNGTIDASLTGAATVTHTYATAGAFVPRLHVTDTAGLRHVGYGDPITVAPAGIAAVTLSAAPASGAVPLNVSFTATAGLASYEWDFDGNGVVDEVTSTETTTHRYLRVGAFSARVVGIDALGRGETGTAAVTLTESSATGGWIVAPLAGDTVDGDALTLVAEVKPGGTAKTVLFQHKQDGAPFGPWTDIGAAFSETGTRARQDFDLGAVFNLDWRDVRALVDAVNSTGDEDEPNVQRDVVAPRILENLVGGLRAKEQLVRVDRTVWMPTTDRADLWFPARSSASGTDITARWENLGDGGGAYPHPTRRRIGDLWRVTVVSGGGSFDNNFLVALPYDDADGDEIVDGISGEDVNALEILRWNGAAWERLFESDVDRLERQVLVRSNQTGIYAIFGGVLTGANAGLTGSGSDGGPGMFAHCSAGGAARGGGPVGPVVAAALALAWMIHVVFGRRPKTP